MGSFLGLSEESVFASVDGSMMLWLTPYGLR